MLRVSLVNNHITFIEQIIIVLKDARNNLSDFAVFSKINVGKIKKKILNFHVRINFLLGGNHFVQLYTLIHHKYLFHFETSVQYIAVYLHHDHLSEK